MPPNPSITPSELGRRFNRKSRKVEDPKPPPIQEPLPVIEEEKQLPTPRFPQITWSSSFSEKWKIINSIAKETITCRERQREVGEMTMVLRHDIESLAAVLAARWNVDDPVEEAGGVNGKAGTEAEVTKGGDIGEKISRVMRRQGYPHAEANLAVEAMSKHARDGGRKEILEALITSPLLMGIMLDGEELEGWNLLPREMRVVARGVRGGDFDPFLNLYRDEMRRYLIQILPLSPKPHPDPGHHQDADLDTALSAPISPLKISGPAATKILALILDLLSPFLSSRLSPDSEHAQLLNGCITLTSQIGLALYQDLTPWKKSLEELREADEEEWSSNIEGEEGRELAKNWGKGEGKAKGKKWNPKAKWEKKVKSEGGREKEEMRGKGRYKCEGCLWEGDGLLEIERMMYGDEGVGVM